MKNRVKGGVFFVAILATLLAVAAVAAPPQEKPCGQTNAALAADRWDPNAAVPADGGQVLLKAVPAPKKSFGVPQVSSGSQPKGGGDDGLRPKVAPVAPYAPLAATVLWDQPLSTANHNAYVDQEFSDYATYSSYLADDFTNEGEWTIGTIFVPGDGWNGFSSLMNATSLTWAIYAEQPEGKPTGPISMMGIPDGYPGGGNAPYWTITLPPTDPQVAISAGTPGGYPSNTTLTLTTPINLPAGTWWLYFYPTMSFGSYGQFGRQASDTTNGAVAQFINPGGGFGYGTGFQNWNVLGAAQQDLAFRLETPSCPAYTYDNGPLVTHPGGGSGGADASAVQTALTLGTYGFGHQFSIGYRVADDFVVTDSAGWDINTIQFYAYQSGSSTTSPLTGVYYQIWNGDPSIPGSAVVFGDTTTNRLTGSVWSNDYRVLDSALTGSTRPIMVSTASCGTHLAPGTYWLDWMTDGSASYSGPWAPPISILGQTTTGNGIQWTGAWAAAVDTSSGTQQGFPFKVNYSVCIVCPTIDVYPYTLPTPTVGVPYTLVFEAYGGTNPYTFAVTAGALPPGLTLAPDGTLSGTLTALGDYSFTVTATDSLDCTGEQSYSMATFSAYFLDDQGRSKLCVNRLTGDYIWEITFGPGAGVYTGVANILNGGTKIYSKPGAPDYLNCTYDAIKKRAAGYYITAAGDYSALKDYNTTNNVGGCFGRPETPN